jgi:hypothetical protein
MRTSIARTTIGASLVLVPVLNLVSALCADAAVAPDHRSELAGIAAHPTRFYVYAITQLVGAYLFIPALLGVKDLLRERRPRWADLAGGVVLLSMLIATGDAATELMYWRMGSAGGNLDAMAAVADSYDNAAGSSLPYAIGGLALMVASIALAIGLWRSKATAWWTALAIPVSIVANIFGYASGSKPLLVVSAVVLLVGFGRIAAIILSRPAARPALVPATA